MADILYAENFPESNIAEQSFMVADGASAQANITLDNAANFSVDDFVLVGLKGGEGSQILKIQSITGDVLTFTTNLDIKHFRNEPVYKLAADQIKFYRAPDTNGTKPPDTAFTLQATKAIYADSLMTPYNDSTGGVGFWYKYTFYNSVSTAETKLADAVAQRGGNYGHYATVEDVRREAGLTNNVYISDQFLFTKLIAAEGEVNGSLLIGGYPLPLTSIPDQVVQATILLAAGYALVTDYGPEHTGTNKDGNQKIAMARAILSKFETRASQLVDPITQLSIGQTALIRGYPDDSAATNTPSEDSFFKQTDRY